MDIKGVRNQQIRVSKEQAGKVRKSDIRPEITDKVSIGGEKSDDKSVKLNILHMNDFHGAVEPMLDPDISKESTVGGIAYDKTVIDTEREKNPEGTMLLNAGDIAEGTMVAYLSKGKVVTDAFKELKFDALALGNHDFAWGQNDLRNMVEGLDTPIVAANVTKTEDGEVMDGAKPYIMKDLNGIKVAVIGLDTPNIRHFVVDSKLEGLNFDKSADTVKKYLPEVKEKGADLVVVLSHLGAEEDKKLAKEVDGIDVIVGGHSHTVMDHGEKVGNTIIVQAGSLGRFIGNLQLDVDPTSKKIVGHNAKLIPVITKDIKPDPQIQKILAPYLAQAEKFGSEVMGEAKEDLHYSHREMGKLNQIHADSICEKSGAPFGICNSRTLRGHVKKGKVTRKDLYSALPFTEEGFVTLNTQGSHIRQHIEDCLADGATELAVPMGSLKYDYDPSKSSGQRLLSVKIDGREMDNDKEYFVCVNETMGRHKNFASSRDKKQVGSSQDEFFSFFKTHSPWDNKIDDRINLLTD
ncbi:MAG: bifunctional metallophosphatase/5'-nucleotidase [Candidatus Eremiobacteraeota bacterium]|nr:bifunctional metallophosphatase/5'-nucleotidase [Candidatus Eremiobacteraeota bacterium]